MPGTSESTLSESHQSRQSQRADDATSVPRSIYYSYLQQNRSPPGRWSHAACAVGSNMLVHGGINSALLDDLALLDGQTLTWRTLSTSAPSPKDRPEKVMGHAAVESGGSVWMFGGEGTPVARLHVPPAPKHTHTHWLLGGKGALSLHVREILR